LTDTNLGDINHYNFVGADNYVTAVNDFFFQRAALVTVRFVIETTVLVTIVSVGIALVLNERFRGSGMLKVLVIVPWAIAEYAVGVLGGFFLNANFGMLNSILTNLGITHENVNWLTQANALDWVAVFYTWNLAPLMSFFVLTALQTVPDDLYKMSRIDGASVFDRFRAVTLPFIRYAVLIVLVLTTMAAGSATVIMFSMTLGGPGGATQTATYYSFVQFLQARALGYGAALSWVIMAFLIATTTVYFYLLTRRRK
jgi:multiple sugar transport system permease protein